MVANKKVVEQGYQGVQEGIELAQALGAAVQGSVLRMGQLNRDFSRGWRP
ncbi:hypothetical protein [Marinobacterium aestuariivivens]|uniref:Uncharacterized protein n=1 Tax=Marinobacterium aestuariivivens TaxID=1698799 RepID=A0ABW2A5W7_9GAMM